MSGRRKALPLSQLQGALMVLDNRRKQPAAAVIEDVRKLVRDAIDVLQEPDPLRRRIEFVFLAIQQSTQIREYQRNGKLVRLARILEPELYHWAMAEAHALAGGGK